MIDYIDTKRIEKLSKNDGGVPLYQKIIKLSEETGELAQAFLKYDGSKNTSASAKGRVEDVLEEGCDVLNVTIDIINALTENSPALELYVRTIFQKKLDKWESKQARYDNPKGGLYNANITRNFEDPNTLRGSIFYTPPINPIKEVSFEEITKTAKEAIVPKMVPEIKQVIEAPVIATKKEPISVKAPIIAKEKPKPVMHHIPKKPESFKFPEELYHSNGMKMVPIIKDFMYKPKFVLTKNQRHYGVEGVWNVVVTWDGKSFITQHPNDYLNNLTLETSLDGIN